MKCFRYLRKLGIVLISLQILAIILASQITTHALSPEINLDIEYLVQIKDGGLVVTSSIIDLQNLGSEPVSSLKVGFSKSFEQYLDAILAYDEQELKVSGGFVEGDVFWVEVSFAESLEPDQQKKLSIYSIFSRLVTPDPLNASIYTVFFPESPVLPFEAARCEVELKLPEVVAVLNSSLTSLLNEVKAPLNANSNQIGFVSFRGDINLMECSLSSSEVNLDSWGNLHCFTSYNIKNVGETTIRDIIVHLPRWAEEISVYDVGGSLGITVTDLDDVKETKIKLRYPLRGRMDKTPYYEACAFTVRYKLDSRQYVTSKGWFNHVLNMRLSAQLELTIRSLVMRITLPEGSTYQASSHSGIPSKNWLTPSIEYGFKNITPIHIINLSVDFEYLTFWVALRPSLWVGGIATFVSVLTLRRRRKRKPSLITSRDDVQLVTSFVDIIDERLILWDDLDSLENNLDDRRIGRRDYNRRKRIMQQRRKTLDSASTSLKNEVRQIEPRYAELIRKLERAEIEISALMENIDRFRAQHRSGVLSKRRYIELKDDYDQKVDNAKRIFESIIIELKRTS